MHLRALGWTILGRNVRVESDEIDVLALEPGRTPTVVVIEVRSRSGARFGHPLESVDERKVARLYRAALTLRRQGWLRYPDAGGLPDPGAFESRPWRIDLLALQRSPGTDWTVATHLRGLRPS